MKPSRDVCSGNWIHSHETFSRCAGDDVEASFVWRDQHVAAAAAFPAHGGRASCPRWSCGFHRIWNQALYI
ncbi:hypothetical protein L195_g053948 [Trifolium pratense]|uniref:Uncharacterized protein n=1 Tax=Trifolium pratense TaxID=57577 RepID=A0A2K3KDE4_TRIPR|nr:hypothetical protein L195_g053948 [Trifolium pratense]